MRRAVRTEADVERVLAANARVVNQPQDVFLRRRPHGQFRIQVQRGRRWVRGEYKDYSTLASLTWAAQVAHDNAHKHPEARVTRTDCEWCRSHTNQGVGS